MEVTEHYVSMGYSGIIVLDSESSESKSGWVDYETQVIACRRSNGSYARVVIWWQSRVLGKRSYHIESEEEMSEAEYQRLLEVHGGTTIDSQDWHQKTARRQAAEAKYQQLMPRCSHGHRMTVRINSRDSSWFFGCSRFPDCRETKHIDRTMLVQIKQLDAERNER